VAKTDNAYRTKKEREKAMITLEKATIYILGAFGYQRIEASSVSVEVKPFAQYRTCPSVRFIERGKRKAKGYNLPESSLLVLAGWNHPEPPDRFIPTEGGQISKYESYSPEYARDFNAAIDAYIAAKRPTVAADFRKKSTT
jgi:hypothetical protein